jgi:integrase
MTTTAVPGPARNDNNENSRSLGEDMRKHGRERQPLTTIDVEKLREPGRYGDGRGGLYLAVSPTRAKSWLFIGTLHGKRHVVGLGSADAVSLVKARAKAAELRGQLKDGKPPIRAKEARVIAKAQRAAAEADAVTFGEMADQVFDSLFRSWRSKKHEYQWHQSLNVYCAPLRPLPVSKIASADVLQVVGPLWGSKIETAVRTRARIERVLDYAKGKGYRSGDNPARWKGGLEALLPKPKPKRERVRHLSAMDYRDLPAFMAELRKQDTVVARALEFAILTAARSSEVLNAMWSEIDFDNKLWVVSAARMKAGQEHQVPLSQRALAILRDVEKFRVTEFVFPGFRDGKPLWGNTVLQVLRQMGHKFTAHGFRSSFRDWCGDCTHFPREVAEAALAHTVGDQTERAYRRGAALEKRRELMKAWANYCEPKADNVVAMRGKPIPPRAG